MCFSHTLGTGAVPQEELPLDGPGGEDLEVGHVSIDPTASEAAAADELTFEEEMVLAAQTAAAAAAAAAEKAKASAPAYPAENSLYKDDVPHAITIFADVGSGGCADVKLAKFNTEDQSAFALKVPRSGRPPHALVNEAAILEDLPPHANIVKLLSKGGYTCL